MEYSNNGARKLILKWANTKLGEWVLFLMAFADASFIPAPTSTFFLALAMINNKRVLKYIVFGTLGTLLGALAGYLAGHLVFSGTASETSGLMHFLVKNIPGLTMETFNKVESLYSKWGIWLLFIAAASPIPYGAFAISSGVFNINIYLFSFVTMLSWGLKFFIIEIVVIRLENLTYSLGFLFKRQAIVDNE